MLYTQSLPTFVIEIMLPEYTVASISTNSCWLISTTLNPEILESTTKLYEALSPGIFSKVVVNFFFLQYLVIVMKLLL